MSEYRLALAGNPNVGKSTIFNALTGLKQHTGNWTGKTVELGEGSYRFDKTDFSVTDLPGTYSLSAFSEEEKVARESLEKGSFDCAVIVVDSSALERNLVLTLEVLKLYKKAVICLNLSDEAEKKGIYADADELSLNLGVPVIKCCAVKKQGLNSLKQSIKDVCEGKTECYRVSRLFKADSFEDTAKEIAGKVTFQFEENKKEKRDRIIDKLLTSKLTGIPAMILMCAALFWITAVGANYPSEFLSYIFEQIKTGLYTLSELLSVPKFLSGIIIDGVYTTLSWVVAVMLPPMAIFFPLFSLIEDSGYLPRIAFNLDKFFSSCGAHGKQSLTMMMGIGCNACGVTGCRIIENKNERLIAVLTNNFMPCNGRFPILIAMIMMFFAGKSFGFEASLKVALILVIIISCCVLLTLFVSKVLSKTIAKGEASSFVLELPPYRKPQIIKTVVRSFLDRTLFVLGRAVIVAAPAGAVIWLCANIYIGDCSILSICTGFLDPFGKFIGLDGVIVMAFILGFPANETVIPIIIMSYMAKGTMVDFTSYEELLRLFTQNGWTVVTAVCMIILTVLHYPCSTTCLTIKKETGSLKWTLASMAIPTVIGVLLCAAVSHILCFWV